MRTRRKAIGAAACVIAVTTLGVSGPLPAQAADPHSPAQAAFTRPDTAFGGSWAASSDQIVAGAGDSAGYHILVARERDAFAWQNLVTLDVPTLDMGPWTGELCTTGDGKYAIAVYAPSAATNKPALEEAGAFAAVVDLRSGAVTPVASGVQLAYYSPGCGLGDTAVLTRALGTDEQETQLLDVHAANGRVTKITDVKSQVTNAVPTAAGDEGMVNGRLARIGAGGSVTYVAKPAGRVYSVVATANGLDMASAVGAEGVVERWDGVRLTRLGSGSLADLQLFPQAGGRDMVVGDVRGFTSGGNGPKTLSRPTTPAAVSAEGDLVADEVLSDEAVGLASRTLGSSAPAGAQNVVHIAAVSAKTGASSSGLIAADGPVSTAVLGSGSGKAATKSRVSTPTASGPTADLTSAISPLTLGAHLGAIANPAPGSDQEIAVDLSTESYMPFDSLNPSCLVGRNDPTRQVLQPTPSMIEWAVDQGVHGDLMVQRPANYLWTGQAAYQPQAMFPLTALSGPTSGMIPAQVMLGILAQESNFKQASWHAVPGDSGNPLVSDYYGTFTATSIADNPGVIPDFSATDCGYGVAQVTDGMSSTKANPLSTAQAVAVATDYAANIAAGLRILAQTWNELATSSPSILLNNGDPKYIENWMFALWGYNSGVHLQANAGSNGGHYGVGWLNNPANPAYPANRSTFLTNPADASTPQKWSYEEKVMGWIQHPQQNPNGADYTTPVFASAAGILNTPTIYQFCTTTVNACNPANPTNPCPTVDSSCWWSAPSTWISTEDSTTASTEHLWYSLGAAEPAMVAQYPADCPSQASFAGAYVVDDLANPNQNVRGCSWSTTSDGKFTIRLGDNIALDSNNVALPQANPLSAQIDLHQIGAGFLGHFYFTHTYDGTSKTSDTTTLANATETFWSGSATVPAQIQHKITATWTPNIPTTATAQLYDIKVALPDHGANATTAKYHIDLGFPNGLSRGATTCTVSQAGTGNRWLDLGTYTLTPGADVWLDNMVAGATGSQDVAFDAVSFTPASTAVTGACAKP